ncbi:MAG TPA: hypothetical protein VKA86_13230 [Candidatus Krumholzibacteria bacterium]|nr:hypothetical protein [Candidatus Krumholzibacteria bacterium]
MNCRRAECAVRSFLAIVVAGLSLFVVSPAVAQDETDREPYRDPFLAALRSAAVPGWGQFHLGHDERGTVYMTVAILPIAVASGVVGVPVIDDEDFERTLGVSVYVAWALLAAVDAHEIAERLNLENGYGLEFRAGTPLAPGREPDPRVTITLLRRHF